MIKDIEKKIKELEEKRDNLIGFIHEYQDDENKTSLVDITRGQSVELLNEIQYLRKLVEQIKTTILG